MKIIEARHLAKRYELGAKKSDSLRTTIMGAVEGLFNPKLPREEFWALRDVGFDIEPGELVAFIGRNGAGKSTLLKILSRIVYPTKGSFRIVGRVGSLLEVGTGFHAELTGRENIFLNGSILGMTRPEIKQKFDEIVEFSGVSQFIDTPVKHYSSGMYVRLAFAVAAHLDPEILIVDEVLAVGDVAFQQKCMGRMNSIAGEGRTVLFVSHNMQAMRTLCRRGIVLKDGLVEYDGDIDTGVDLYEASMLSASFDASTDSKNYQARRGSGQARIQSFFVGRPGETEHSYSFEYQEPIEVRVSFKVERPIERLYFQLYLISMRNMREVIFFSKEWIPIEPLEVGQTYAFRYTITEPDIRPGTYPIHIKLVDYLINAVDGLFASTLPISIVSRRSFDELGFDPALPSGYTTLRGQLQPIPVEAV
jgi:lipopolysaccharide transport system ATP-binding protein